MCKYQIIIYFFIFIFQLIVCRCVYRNVVLHKYTLTINISTNWQCVWYSFVILVHLYRNILFSFFLSLISPLLLFICVLHSVTQLMMLFFVCLYRMCLVTRSRDCNAVMLPSNVKRIIFYFLLKYSFLFSHSSFLLI